MTTGISAAFIVARLDSSRLPGKQLRTIGGTTLLQWIFDALKLCRELDRIVLATVAEKENNPLREWTEQRQFDCFWYEGATDHVTTRLRRAAEHYDADICVLISADCPLIDPLAIDTLIQNLKATPKADYCMTSNDADNQSCMLQGVLVARRESWQRGDDLSDRPELREHHFPIFGLRPDLFKSLPCRLDPSLYGQYHRLSIDTWSDLTFCNQLHDLLKENGRSFTLANAVDLLKEQPYLKAINQHVHQKKLIENTQRLALIFTAPPKPTAFSAYKNLALQILDRLGWPITFLNDDAYADQIKEIGMRSMPTFPLDESDMGNLKSRFDLLVIISEGIPPSWRHLSPGLPTLYLAQTDCANNDENTLSFHAAKQNTQEFDLILVRLQQMAAGESA